MDQVNFSLKRQRTRITILLIYKPNTMSKIVRVNLEPYGSDKETAVSLQVDGTSLWEVYRVNKPRVKPALADRVSELVGMGYTLKPQVKRNVKRKKKA